MACLCLSTIVLGNNGPENKSTTGNFSLPKGITEKDYLKGTVIFRLKDEFRSHAGPNEISISQLMEVLNEAGLTQLKKLFPSARIPLTEKNAMGQPMADISLIYQAKFSASENVLKVVNGLISTGKVKYAEPKYIYRSHFTPNDPNFTNAGQYFINKIKCDSAWDVNTTTARGDTNVVIGIIDTGTDWDHPDLAGNLKINYADPIDGTDNDADGYTDNYRGWDMADNDNNPTVSPFSSHGSHVSGCADARTNNSTGVAGPGFNCKFMAVKAAEDSDPDAYLTAGYEGITYAAEHGCHIINCSWGGDGSGNLGQDVVQYATVNLGAVVFASAGNDGQLKNTYPASYNYVYNIAATNNIDKKASFSNFGYTVDMSAPGQNIYSTQANNTYATNSGTSMASPIAAGAAGIVKSFYPGYNGQQVAEKLRVTCDNVDPLQSASHQQKIGKGRVNLYRALTTNPPSVRMINIQPDDFNDHMFVVGDTVRVLGDFFNYLDPTSNLTVTLTTTATAVTILNSTINVGVLGTLGTFNTNSNPFSFKINPTAPANASILFKINFSDGSYTDLQYLQVVVNVDYINITINDVKTTNTSKGSLGYNADGQQQGLGFAYQDSGMMYEAGLMIGISGKVVDNIRGATGGSVDADFVKQNVIQQDDPSPISDFDLSGSFTDNGAAVADRVGVTVKHRSFAWDSLPFRKFVMFQYNIVNSSTSNPVANLYAGIFADWDITEKTYESNFGEWDPVTRMGMVYNTGSGLWAGTKLLSHEGDSNCYNIDNITGGGGGVDVTNGYTTALKFQTLSTTRTNAGSGSGNDILNVVSAGPINLSAGDSAMVAFALVAGSNEAELKSNAAEAQVLYDFLFPYVPDQVGEVSYADFRMKAFPNPAKNFTEVWAFAEKGGTMQVRVSDIAGKIVFSSNQEVQTSEWNRIFIPLENVTSGMYLVEVLQAGKVLSEKLLVTE